MLKNNKEHDKYLKMLFLAIFFYVLLFSYLSWLKYLNFDYHIYDLGIFNQVFFNTLSGDWFHLTINPNIYLADHFTPIVILLLPIYWLWQSPIWLLILQSLIIGLSAWPIYLLGKKIIANNKLGLFIALAWLFNPFVHGANLFEFHLMPLAVFFVFWTFYFYKKNNFVYFLLFFILSLLVREDISLILFGFFILSLLDKKSLKWKLVSLFLPLLYFLLALKVIGYFYQGGDYKFFIYYGWLGGDNLIGILLSWLSHPWQLLLHIFSFQNIGTVFIILLPFLFLPLLRKKYLWLLFLPLLQFLLTASSLDFMVYSSHYILLFLPALFIALIFAVNKIKNKESFFGSKLIYKNKKEFLFLTVFTILYFFVFLSPIKSVLFADYDSQQTKEKQEFIKIISPNDKVIAESSFVPHLSSRKELYVFSYSYFGTSQFSGFDFKVPEVDYIIIDFSQALSVLTEKNDNHLLQNYKNDMAKNWREYLQDYTLIKAKNDVFLWQNKKTANFDGLNLFDHKLKPADFIEDPFLVLGEKREDFLELTFQKKHNEEKEYLVRFYKDNGFFDVPLDYAIFPETEWPDNELLSFYYYPDKSVKAYQVFSWQGANKLGNRKEMVVDLKLYPETEKIILSDI